MKIYIIKEIVSGGDGKIIGAVSDENTAKRFCRDMRKDRELCYVAVDLDSPDITDIPEEKIYRIVRETYWITDRDSSVSEVYHRMLEITPIALVVDGDFVTAGIARLRSVMLESTNNSTTLEFWCYAKTAPDAIDIMNESLEGLDPAVLKWGVYHPTSKD